MANRDSVHPRIGSTHFVKDRERTKLEGRTAEPHRLRQGPQPTCVERALLLNHGVEMSTGGSPKKFSVTSVL